MKRILTEEQKLNKRLYYLKNKEKINEQLREKRTGPEGDKIREKCKLKEREKRDKQYIINEKKWYYENLELIDLFDKFGINKDNKNLYDKFYPQYDIETIKRIVIDKRKWNDKVKHNYEKDIII
jgi:hypothetical protein